MTQAGLGESNWLVTAEKRIRDLLQIGNEAVRAEVWGACTFETRHEPHGLFSGK